MSKQLVAAALNCSVRTCLVLMFVACAGFGFGQSVDSPEYHEAKANGTLPSEDLSLPFSGSQEQLDFMATPLSSSASSFLGSNPDCFIPIEDDWSELAANDDGSTSLISLPFTFSMYGQDYTAVYVNNNGNITFDTPFSTFSASGFPISTPMVAPFWGDVDTRIVTGEDNGQVRYKVNDHSLVVTWDAVASYSATSGYADGQRNTFQVIITDGTDGTLAAGNNIGFRYGTMDWTTGSASNGVDGFGGFPANVGVNAGNGADFFQVGLFDQEGTAYDGAFGNNDGVDYLENSCFEFNVTDGMNFPPAVQSAPASVLNYCDGEMTADFQFIGPENDQSVTITFNSPDGLGFEEVNNESGAVATASVSFVPATNGTFTFEAIATDDFESPASTVVSIEVIVDGCAVEGCTDATACNYDASANTDDGSCILPDGCTDLGACNYDADATCNDGSCEYPGCIDTEACNYDATAGCADASCTYPDFGYDCNGDCLPVANNDCSNATPILCGGVFDGLTSCATATPGLEDCAGDNEGQQAPEVWFIVQGTGGAIEITTCSPDTDYDTYINVYTGSCGSLTCFAGNDDSGTWEENPSDTYTSCDPEGTQSYVQWISDLGVDYYIAISGWNGNDGIFEFSMACETVSCGLDECPADATVACNSDYSPAVLGFPTVQSIPFACNYDPCAGGYFEYEDSFVDGPAGSDCNVVVERTFTRFSSGGEALFQCQQLITLFDDVAPEFDSEVADQTVICLEEVPSPEMLTAYDACMDANVDVEIFESNNGNVTDICALSEAIGPGDDWSLWLPTLSQDGFITNANFVFDANGGSFEQYNDGTARLFGTLVNEDNANEIFELDLWFDNKSDWNTWSALGRSYKDDLNCATPDALYEDWTYYTLADGFSSAMGAGDLAGAELYFYHMPADYFFGFQLGEGANNKNCNHGFSGWFTYQGFVNGTQVEGYGDVNVDAECEPNNETDCPHNTEFTYLYRAQDDCGNVNMVSQIITVNDNVAPEFTVFPEDITIECDETYEIPAVEAEDNCEGDVEIVGPFMTETPGDCADSSVIEYAWSATDLCGNQTNMIWTITVVDTTDPEFNEVAADVTVECDQELPAPFATATDNCDDEVTIDVTEEIIEGDCPQEYTMIRTYTATDNCGNSETAQQVLNVIDTTAPVFADYEYYTSVPCEEVEDYTLEANDNCGEVTVEIIEEELLSGGCLGVLIRTYQATDECGNMTEAEQYITITDITAPEIMNVPAAATVECDEVGAEDGTLFGSGDVTAEDNCEGEVELTYAEEIVPGECEDSYTVIRTWTAVDYCENESMVQVTMTVQDTTDPVFVEVPADITVECDEELPAVEMPIAEDNCDGDVDVEVTEEIEAGDCPQEYTLMRIFRGFDNCGNETMYVQNIFVVDTTAPVFTSVPADATYECDEEIAVMEATAADNCGEVTVTMTDGEIIAGECPQAYSFVRTFTATDACGNSVSADQLISVEDTTAPAVDGEAFLEMPCDMISDEILVTATDNCDEEVEITFIDNNVSGGCVGNVIRTYTATDDCGNSTEFTQVINLFDEVAPEFSAFPADVTAECDNVPSVSEMVDAEDNCTEASVEYNGEEFIAGDCLGNYTLVRTWTATDNCGNATVQSQTITVVDTTAPEFTSVPADATYECDAEIPAFNAEAEDNCGIVEVTFEDVVADGECANASIITRTFTATDDCGNSATAVQTINVVDTTAPELEIAADVTIECDQEVPAAAWTASDNCSEITEEVTEVTIEGDCPNNYTIERTYSVTDACGNNTSATQIITVQDTTAPVIEGEAFLEMPCDQIDNAILVSATDNCDEEVEITFIDNNVSGGCVGNLIRTYTATDDCGNSSEFVQVINLTDEIAPEFSAFPADVTAECDEVPGVSDMVDAEDNCSEASIEYNGEEFIAGDCLGNYTLVRTWTATDNCGNATVQSQTITVVDTTAPEFTSVPADATYECDEEIPAFNAEAEDNCGTVQVTFEDVVADGECANASIITRTFTATDDCGNSATAVQTINVVDTTAPELEIAADVTIECDQEVPAAAWTASDNCSEITEEVTEVTVEGDCPNNYTIERTYSVTDACGNNTSATQIITVQDTTAPVIEGEAFLEMPCDQIDNSILVSATDNCSPAVDIVYSDESVSGGCAGNVIRTYTATDDCGNSSEFVQVINLTDEVAPELAGVPADATIECGDEIPAPAEVSASDNCDDELEVLFSEEIVMNECLYSIVRTWSVVDHCTNATSASQTITIVDTTAPALEVAADVTVECDQEVPAAAWEASDICDEDLTETVTEVVVEGDCPNNYTIERTYTVSDDCGNTSSLMQTITVVDTTAPEFTNVPSGNEFECDETVEYGEATAADNCGDVTITFADMTEAGQCANEYTIVRTWTATDACGNAAEAQSFYYIYDATAPSFDGSVEDVNVECADEVPAMPELTATDNCSEATVSMSSEVLEQDECGNGVTVVTYIATDACGNTAELSYTITVNDVTAPELSDTPEDLVIDCEAEVPAPAEISALDNCSEVEVIFTEEILGNAPAEGSIADCVGYTGESPFYETDWSLWLQAFPGDDDYYTTTNVNFVEYPDGTATISGSVISTSTAGGWTIDVTLENGMDWESWSSQDFPASYKDDFGVAGENYLDWTYYIVSAGNATLTGTGIYEGDVLELSHAPANYYYAFQVGVGANNTTANYGGGGWFYYDGTVGGMDVSGAGDFAFDLDCCPQYEILRTWTATDCSGNSVSHSQIISFADLGEEAVAEEGAGDNWSNVAVERENKAQHTIFPNPTNAKSMIQFVNDVDGHTVIEVYSLNGTKVADVFNQETAAGLNYRADIDAQDLADGIYLVRIQHNGQVTTDRLIISK